MGLRGPVEIRGDATASGKNLLAVPLHAKDRVVWVYLQPEPDTAGRCEVKWDVSATLRCATPKGGKLFSDPRAGLFQLRPDRVTIAPLRARAALVLAAFLPTAPTFDFLDVYFLGAPEPNYAAKVWAEASPTLYAACGLFSVPFGAFSP